MQSTQIQPTESWPTEPITPQSIIAFLFLMLFVILSTGSLFVYVLTTL